MRIDNLSFRNGKEYFVTRPELLASILAAVINAQEARLKSPGLSITSRLRREFRSEGWAHNFPVFEGKTNSERFDLFRERVAVEIEFSQSKLLHRAFMRFSSAYNVDGIDVGVIITCARGKTSLPKSKPGRSDFEGVRKELNQLKPAFLVPVWVIGVK